MADFSDAIFRGIQGINNTIADTRAIRRRSDIDDRDFSRALGLDEEARQQRTIQNDLARRRLDIAEQGVERGGVSKFGVSPVFGQDEQGNTVVLQLGQQGEAIQTPMPSGVTPLSPQEINQQRALGTGSGKIEAERPQAASKAMNMLQSLDSQWSVVDQDIDRAIEAIEGGAGPGGVFPTTGLGAVAAGVPQTSAHNLSNLLETIRANIGFDKLQEMRTNSPTGGALGQVSNFENRLLQSVRGSLQQTQDAGQLVQNLRRVKEDLGQLRQDRFNAFQRDFGEVTQNQALPGGPPENQGEILQQANEAIEAGADPNQVMQRLRQMGIEILEGQ